MKCIEVLDASIFGKPRKNGEEIEVIISSIAQ